MKIKFLNWWVIALLVLYASCEEADLEQVDNLHAGRMLAIGHGGSGFQSYFNPIPPNSLRSVSRALDGLNADGVEVDVQLTADKKLVLYHDEHLETQTNCFGCISEQTAEQVLNCRYNLDVGNSLRKKEPLILLETLLAKYFAYKIKPQIFFDLKLMNGCGPASSPKPEDFAEAVARLIIKYQAQAWTRVESTSEQLLQKLKEKNAGIRLSYYAQDPVSGIQIAVSNGFDGITIANDLINKTQIHQAHQHKLFVTLFGVKSRNGLIETMEKFPDAIQTDNVELMIEILQESN